MKAFLENIKNKSREEKRKYAFLGALFLTFLIFIIWFTAHNAINSLKQDSEVESSINPFSDLKQVFGPLFDK